MKQFSCKSFGKKKREEELSDDDLIFLGITTPQIGNTEPGLFSYRGELDGTVLVLHLQHNTERDVRSSPAVVGSTVPIAVLAVPLGVLAVHWVRGPWRL